MNQSQALDQIEAELQALVPIEFKLPKETVGLALKQARRHGLDLAQHMGQLIWEEEQRNHPRGE